MEKTIPEFFRKYKTTDENLILCYIMLLVNPDNKNRPSNLCKIFNNLNQNGILKFPTNLTHTNKINKVLNALMGNNLIIKKSENKFEVYYSINYKKLISDVFGESINNHEENFRNVLENIKKTQGITINIDYKTEVKKCLQEFLNDIKNDKDIIYNTFSRTDASARIDFMDFLAVLDLEYKKFQYLYTKKEINNLLEIEDLPSDINYELTEETKNSFDYGKFAFDTIQKQDVHVIDLNVYSSKIIKLSDYPEIKRFFIAYIEIWLKQEFLKTLIEDKLAAIYDGIILSNDKFMLDNYQDTT